MKTRCILVVALLNLISPPLCAQTATLHIEGEVERTLKLSVADLVHFKQHELSAKDKDGQEHRFKGIKLYDLLDSAGVTLGGKLWGKNLTKYVLVKAADGYEVTFAPPEIDPEFSDQIILLAIQVDGVTLHARDAPFRLVVPKDKKHARWIREIVTIKVLFARD